MNQYVNPDYSDLIRYWKRWYFTKHSVAKLYSAERKTQTFLFVTVGMWNQSVQDWEFNSEWENTSRHMTNPYCFLLVGAQYGSSTMLFPFQMYTIPRDTKITSYSTGMLLWKFPSTCQISCPSVTSVFVTMWPMTSCGSSVPLPISTNL